MRDWQPIETAPRDGTEIDVWEYCHDPKWRPDCHGLQSGHRMTDIQWCDGEWTARNDDVEQPGDPLHYTISHWMPKPAAPQSEENVA